MRTLVLAGKIGPAFGTRTENGNVFVSSVISVVDGNTYSQEFRAKREAGSLLSKSVVRSMRKVRTHQVANLLGYVAQDYCLIDDEGISLGDYAANLPAAQEF